MTTVARRRNHDSGDYSDASQHENDQDVSENGGQNVSDYDSAASDSERSDRDPDSQEAERRVDDDEDRSNPQYIPKRGTFYEHDDRTADNGEDTSQTVSETASEKKEGSTTPAERRRGPRKTDSGNKWSHDKYNENEQAPKSRDELVAIYGYDIRNEDAPPHARRNRRYGRGPNKYTRTWEDEEAYRRQAAAPPARKPPSAEEFPDLDAANRGKKRMPRPRSKSQPSLSESMENGLHRNPSIKTPRGRPRQPLRAKKETNNKDKDNKMPAIENLTITATVANHNTSNNQSPPLRKVNATVVAQQRPVPTEQAKKKPAPPAQPTPQPTAAPNKSPPQQQKPQQQHQQQKPEQQQQPTTEPRGSKRYSSLRQRPLDTYAQAQHPQRYHGDFPAGAPPSNQHQTNSAQMAHPQQMMQQMHRNASVSQQHGPSPPHQLPSQQIPQPALPPQQMQPTLPQQQIPPPLPQQQIQQALPQQQMPPPLPQALPQQQMQQALPQQQLQQALPPQLPQQALPQQQLAQQQIQQQQLSQQQISQQQQVRLNMLEQQQMVSHPHHTMHNMPQHMPGQLQPTQAYAPPAMMPAQYMQVSQQSGNAAVFGGAPMYAQPPAPYPHQLYQHHNYATQAGGVTYYSCAEQEQIPRAQRRPTAAIPIVRPAAPDRPANSTEKDNIDRIVENMFVRKPWPSTHGADSKEKSTEPRNPETNSKESSQPNSLTSSSISTDSKPSESIEREKPEVNQKEEVNPPEAEVTSEVAEVTEVKEESISDA